MKAQETVVFDLDDTVIRGDSAARLIRELIRRHWWRRVLAVFVAPLGYALMASQRGRRLGVSAFLWTATVGETEASFARHVDEFVAQHPLRVVPPVMEAIQREIAAGHRVIIATGAMQTVAAGLVSRLQFDMQPQVVGSTVRRFCGGYVAQNQANGPSKLLRLAEAGFHPPFDRCWSDHAMDLPLLRATRQPCFVCWQTQLPEAIQRALPDIDIIFPQETQS